MPGSGMSHSVPVYAGSVEKTPFVQSSHGARRGDAHVLVVGGEVRGLPVRIGGADRQPDAGRAARPAEDRRRKLRGVAVGAGVAGGRHREDVVHERQRQGARERWRLAAHVAGEAHVEHVGAFLDRVHDPAQEIDGRELVASRGADGEHLRVAGHALPADAVAVDRGDQARDERAVADLVGHVVPPGGGVERVRDPADELRMVDVEPAVDHRDRAARAAARGGDGVPPP